MALFNRKKKTTKAKAAKTSTKRKSTAKKPAAKKKKNGQADAKAVLASLKAKESAKSDSGDCVFC